MTTTAKNKTFSYSVEQLFTEGRTEVHADRIADAVMKKIAETRKEHKS